MLPLADQRADADALMYGSLANLLNGHCSNSPPSSQSTSPIVLSENHASARSSVEPAASAKEPRDEAGADRISNEIAAEKLYTDTAMPGLLKKRKRVDHMDSGVDRPVQTEADTRPAHLEPVEAGELQGPPPSAKSQFTSDLPRREDSGNHMKSSLQLDAAPSVERAATPAAQSESAKASQIEDSPSKPLGGRNYHHVPSRELRDLLDNSTGTNSTHRGYTNDAIAVRRGNSTSPTAALVIVTGSVVNGKLTSLSRQEPGQEESNVEGQDSFNIEAKSPEKNVSEASSKTESTKKTSVSSSPKKTANGVQASKGVVKTTKSKEETALSMHKVSCNSKPCEDWN